MGGGAKDGSHLRQESSVDNHIAALSLSLSRIQLEKGMNHRQTNLLIGAAKKEPLRTYVVAEDWSSKVGAEEDETRTPCLLGKAEKNGSE